MPTYRITAPDGTAYNVTAPDGATQDQVLAYAQAHHGEGAATADARTRVGNTPNEVQTFARGASLGFVDKLDGASAAAETAFSNLRGDRRYTPGQAYDAVVKANQERGAAYSKAHPVASTAIGLAGGIAAPGAVGAGRWAAGGTGMLDLISRGLLVGTSYGAAAGAGNAAPGAEAKGAIFGGLTGGAMGGALPPAAAGLGKVATRALAPAVAAVARRAPGGLGQLGAAAQAVPTRPMIRAARALDAAVKRDVAGGQIDDLAKPLMYGRGRNVQGLMDVVAKSPGPGATILQRAADAAKGEATNNVRADLGQHLGGQGNFWETLDGLLATRRDNAREGMSKLGHHLVTLDEGSIAALRSDRAKGALKEAALNGLASTDADEHASAAGLNHLVDTLLDKPSASTMTVRQAQDISEALLSAADSAYKGGDGAKGKALKGLGKAIRENARTPERGGFAEYDDWLKQYATDSEAKRALDLGAQVFKGGLEHSPEKVARELAGMGSDAIDHFRKGVGEAMFNAMNGARGDVGLMRDMMKDQNLAAKVRLAFPDEEAFKRFMAAADERVHQANVNGRYAGGSPTSGLDAARADLEAQGGGFVDAIGALMVGPRAMAGAALKRAGRALPGKPKNALTDPAANAALGRAGNSPAEVDRLLKLLATDKRLRLAPKAAQVAGRATPALSTQASRR